MIFVKSIDYNLRIIDKTVEEYLSTFGAVCIEGPKWCGKTWTSAYHSKSKIFLGDPANNFQNRQLAQMSPELILEGSIPRLIDEWQEVPPIWDAVRHAVDQTSEKGLYILTGSSTPNHKGIMHSGAGRIAKLRMRPMSLYESKDSDGSISLEKLCNEEFTPRIYDDVDINNLANLIIRGGWPGSINIPAAKSHLLPKEYIKAIVDDDMYRLDNIERNKSKIMLLLRSLARNESTTVSYKTLQNDIKNCEDETLDSNTIASYLDIFNRLFLIDNQPPFSTNIRSSVRVKQAEKIHFSDPSLACALLKLTPKSLIGDLKTFGFLFEALCERDLKIYAESFGASLYHYQDYKNREIDAIVQLKDGRWCAFEIKLGANQIEDAAKNLTTLRDAISSEKDGIPPSVLCVICGMSKAAYKREDGVYVVPITSLKP